MRTRYQASFFASPYFGYMPYICALYFAGPAGLNTFKLGLGMEQDKADKTIGDLRQEQMQQFINTFSKKLNIDKPIRLKFSQLVDVPCMIGYFKPLILLPVFIIYPPYPPARLKPFYCTSYRT